MSLGKHQEAFDQTLRKLRQDGAVRRIWAKDATFWSSAPEAQKIIGNALGWLTVPNAMAARTAELTHFAVQIKDAGFRHAVVLGMGGSSLCPEVLRRTFGKQAGHPELLVLDSTVPAAVQNLERRIDVAKTLFLVASKSGTTTEPQVFFQYFYARLNETKGGEAGANFVAITDPGTQLAKEAQQYGFRKTFENPADIGGRYSALSLFGLVPFAIMGGDVAGLLQRAGDAARRCSADGGGPDSDSLSLDNPGLKLGAALGAFYRAGRDKLTVFADAPADSLGLWIEQLIAESTGKEGKGIVPVVLEPMGTPEEYGQDRVFVAIESTANGNGNNDGNTDGNKSKKARLAALEAAGHPVLRCTMRDPLDLGEQFFVWEMATAVAGAVMGIDPFDQPNVQESKDNTKTILASYKTDRKLPEERPLADENGIRVFGSRGAEQAKSPEAAISAHLHKIRPNDYVAFTEYVAETPEHDAVLEQIRTVVRNHWRVATTTGYGPRFLHSTGQLHKGGAGNGVFVQITSLDPQDLPIPDQPFSFSVLKQAQALGDFQSLEKRGRRAIRVDLGSNVEEGLRWLLQAIEKAAASLGGSAA